MKARNRQWWLMVMLPSTVLITVITLLSWMFRASLSRLISERPAVLPAAAIGLTAWLLVGGLILLIRGGLRNEQYRQRLQALTGIERLKARSALGRWLDRLPDPLEWLFGPLLATPWGRRRALEWEQAGLGDKPSRYLILLLVTMLVAGYLALQLGGVLLAISVAALAPVAPYRWVVSRARDYQRRFTEQVPAALDALAAGVSAGLSFQQSIRFAVGELPQPIAQSLAVVDRRIRLGHPVEEVIQEWAQRHPDEGLTLAVDGILLQRQMGGNLVDMLQRTADIARERVELQREVQAVTAQGRLSGWVIGGLVPISAGILLASNPRYIDVLFNTLIGQALLVVALVLQLFGWLVISRLIRVVY